MSIESPLIQAYTDEKIAEYSRLNPHMRLERGDAGELVAVSALDAEGARRVSALCMQLAVWHGEYRAGELFDSSTGFRFGDGTLLFADAAWVERDRWKWLSDAERRSFPPICPSVAFTMTLPGDSSVVGEERARMFLAGGAKAAVLLDVEQRSIVIHRPRSVDDFSHRRDVRVVELGYFTIETAKIFG